MTTAERLSLPLITHPSNLFLDDAFDRSDRVVVAPVHRPLLDPLGSHQFCRDQDPHVLAQRRRADAEFFRDENAANAIVDQTAVHLLAKMLLRIDRKSTR